MNKIALLLASIATTTTSSSATRAAATNLAFVSSSTSLSSSYSSTLSKLKNTNIHKMSTASSVEQKQALLSCPTIPLRDGTSHPMM